MHVELDNASKTKIPPRRGLSQAVLYYKYAQINRPQDTVYYSLDTLFCSKSMQHTIGNVFLN